MHVEKIKSIKVTIDKNKSFPFHAIAKSEDGKQVIVKNGDLVHVSELEVVFIADKGYFIYGEIPQTYMNQEFIEENADEDGLFSTKSLTQINNQTFQINDKWVFIDRKLNSVFHFLIKNDFLWLNSKLRFVPNRYSIASAIHFGLSFESVLKKATDSGMQKIRLYCPNKQLFKSAGVVAEMLVNLYQQKDKRYAIEIWQGVEESNHVYYAHGILNSQMSFFEHFDCAEIGMSISEQELLFSNNTKIKTSNYKKMFRIDGKIEKQHVIELGRRFFPLDHLIDEFFEVQPIARI